MFDAFYSDPHFGHEAIIGYASRPYASAEEMEQALVENYNRVVAPGDLVLWLGDCFFTSVEKSTKILERLNGRKALVRGNHDRSPQRMVSQGFAFVAEELYFQIGEHAVRAVHYPYRRPKSQESGYESPYRKLAPQRKPGVVLMHGHSHDFKKSSPQAVHVGVDAWDYRPALRHEVEAILDALK